METTSGPSIAKCVFSLDRSVFRYFLMALQNPNTLNSFSKYSKLWSRVCLNFSTASGFYLSQSMTLMSKILGTYVCTNESHVFFPAHLASISPAAVMERLCGFFPTLFHSCSPCCKWASLNRHSALFWLCDGGSSVKSRSVI